VKLGIEYWFLSIDHVGEGPLASRYPVGWNRIHFLPTAQLGNELSFKSRFTLDNFGVNAQGLGSGHLRSSGSDSGSPFYIDWAYLSYTPKGEATHFGIMHLAQQVRLGPVSKNPFNSATVYSFGLTRYGGVGTPPLTATNQLDASPSRMQWLLGTNVALETLDPNSAFVNFPSPSLSLIHQRQLGTAQLSLATSNGNWATNVDRALTSPGLLYLPRNYPLPAALYDGYSLVAIEDQFGPARLQAALRADNRTMGTVEGKSSSVTIDWGGPSLAASLTLAGRNLPLDSLGGYVWADNVAGFGLGAGIKSQGMGFLQSTSYPFLSYGPILKTPSVIGLPSVTLALQQTQGTHGEALASGYTIETQVRPFAGLAPIGLEYSSGKFNAAGSNALFDPISPFTHHVYAVSMLNRF
jgi:hypothetical protein